MGNNSREEAALSCFGHIFQTEGEKTLKVKPFRFLGNGGVSKGSDMKYINYRPPRLVKTKKKWYILYYYRVPAELSAQYNTKWQRFRVYEDINRHKTEEYAELLLKAVCDMLKDGYNPFQVELEDIYQPAKKTPWSLNYGLDKFIDYCKEKGLREKTLQTYGSLVNFLKEYFLKDNKIYQHISEFTKDDLKTFMWSMKKKQSWANFTFNNNQRTLGTIFNWFMREEIIDKNPAQHLEELPVQITRHRYYDNKTAEKIKSILSKEDPYLLKFCEFIYYSGVRPKSEARFLQVKHILFDRGLLFIPASVSKNKKDDFVPMCDELKELLKGLVNGHPEDFYIFGKNGPSLREAPHNYFSVKFKVYKDRLKISSDHTIYSFKHSRAIALAEAGADPYQIMRLFRHSSLEQTMHYLRELGCNISDEINKKTRKF